MMKKIKLILFTLSITLFTACSTVSYEPKGNMSTQEAKSNIETLLYAQYHGYIPGDVKVTDEYVKTFYDHTVVASNVIVFKSIKKMEIIKFGVSKVRYYVDVYGVNKHKDANFIMNTEEDAKALVNAIETMRRESHKKQYKY